MGSRFEAYCTVAITPAVDLTFDLQVGDPIIAAADPAWILGARLRIQF